MRYNVYWISGPDRFLFGISSFSPVSLITENSGVRFLSLCLWGTFSLGWANWATYNRCRISQGERQETRRYISLVHAYCLVLTYMQMRP